MPKKKAIKKKVKAEPEKKVVTPRRSIMQLSINGSLEDVLRASFTPPKKD